MLSGFKIFYIFVWPNRLIVEELREIARKCMIQDYLRYKKDGLVRLIGYHCVKRIYETIFLWKYMNYVSDITHELVQKSVEKRMCQESMRAWVGLFVSDESGSEHYAQVILDVLYPMSCFEEKSDTKYVRHGLKNGNEILFRKPERRMSYFDMIDDDTI